MIHGPFIHKKIFGSIAAEKPITDSMTHYREVFQPASSCKSVDDLRVKYAFKHFVKDFILHPSGGRNGKKLKESYSINKTWRMCNEVKRIDIHFM